MRALLIGGTGTISLPITRKLIAQGWQVTLLNRGNKNDLVPGAEIICCDMNDAAAAEAALRGRSFDVVAQFIAYHPDQVARDIQLFTGKTRQYIFISSASAYIKPTRNPVITESTPLSNPYWLYSRNKIACEQLLCEERDRKVFPMTIVRPSHTYCGGKAVVAPKLSASEDFSEFQKKVPGVFFFLGSTDPKRDLKTAAPNHSPKFEIDEASLAVGARAMTALALDYLAQP